MERLSNRYRLQELLGQGGMAKVYKAEDEVLGRTVAVKVLREQYANDQAFVGRFLHEARSAASFSHPNIVNIFDVGDDHGQYFIVMECVDGVSLKDLIQKEAPFPVERALRIASQICAGLQAAHGRQLIHRDIKPQNVLVTSDGQVKIADFGIARALGEASFSETGQVFGSVHYLSPEQAQGKQATPASDIYSLGVVCYEMLTGRLPFEGETVVGVALRHIQETPQPPHEINHSVSPTMEAIVLKALAKDSTERYPSAKEMGQALQQYEQLGEQSTGVISAVKAKPSPVASANTTRIAPVTATGPAAARSIAAARSSSGGGNFLLFVLAIIAIISVLGLCALSGAIYQTFNEKFTASLPSIGFGTPVPSPSAVALVEVPKVEGMDASQARATIEARGLVYVEGPPESSDTVPAGHVIRQSAQPGTSIHSGLEVTVVLSKGKESIEVPFVIGYEISKAQTKLEGMGLVVAKNEQANGSVSAGLVFDQDPQAGVKVSQGTTVTLSVSKAKTKVTVPDVVGKSEAEAKKAITDAGLRNFEWTNYQSISDVPESLRPFVSTIPVGSVISITPKAGTEVDPGTEIRMSVRKD